MLGIVTATRLHIRAKPGKSSLSRGVLSKGTAVKITGQVDDWVEISYQDFPAYLYRSFVSLQEEPHNLTGVVSADLLNVRSKPDLNGAILGKLSSQSRVDIVSLMPQWIEINFNDQLGYVSREYISLQTAQLQPQGVVTASLLNVRHLPGTHGNTLGQLARNATVTITGVADNWLQIDFNGVRGFVHSRFVEQRKSKPVERPVTIAADDDDSVVVPRPAGSVREPMSPERQLPIRGDALSRKVAATWNRYGELLNTQSSERQIDVACAVSVLCVESSGQGFRHSNQDRMVIRFENHKFWKYWGLANPDKFREHFSYRKGEAWKDHKWRADASAFWQSFHGNQEKEWQVLNFARTLDEEAAMLSISMGAPQIMGFHHARLGYPSAAAMFEAFSADIGVHIRGLFSFLDDPMLNALQNLDFEEFAGRYNGSGQRQKYGGWIRNHYDAFKTLQLTYSLS